MKNSYEPCTWTVSWINDPCDGDLGHGMYEVYIYISVSLMTVLREQFIYKPDLVGVQEVRWEGSCTTPAGECTFCYGKENENHELSTVFSYIRESYQQIRGFSLLVTGCHTEY
jgi:hypothetical protein